MKQILVTWSPLLLAALNWLIVRYGRDDTKFPIDIPLRLKPWVPIVLSVIAAGLARFVAGATWPEVVKLGVAGAFGPTAFHQLIVESLRDGHEIPVPGMAASLLPPRARP